MPGALSPEKVTNAFTLNSPWLTGAILHGCKPVENRSQDWKPGWYAVHTGVGRLKDEWAEEHVKENAGEEGYSMVKDDIDSGRIPRGHIAGMCRFAHTLPWEACETGWALGPYCMVIAEWQWLSQPIECKGQLGLWGLTDEVRALIKERSLSSGIGTLGAHYRWPPNPTALAAAKQAALEEKRAKRKRE